MSESELRKALLSLDAADLSGVPDLKQQTWQVLERDRRRVRRLTFVTVGVWLLATALVWGALVSYGFTFPQQAKLMRDVEDNKLTADERDQAQRLILISFQKGTLLVGFSVAVLALAALCTVLLLFSSRRATLRQINASLLEIAQQLKQLRPSSGP